MTMLTFKLKRYGFFICLLAFLFLAFAPAVQAQPASAEMPAPHAAYTLPPAQRAAAESLARSRNLLFFAASGWQIVFPLLLLGGRVVARLRRVAGAVTQNFWFQGLLFLPSLLVLVVLAELPFSIAGHHLSLAYGQSIQPWGSWLWDWSKSLLLTTGVGTLLLLALFAIVRRAPRTWWLWAWLASLPLQVFAIFVLPYVIDPLFNRFEPLSQSHPALVEQLESVVRRGGLDIPPSRIYLMRASNKVTTLNAYVTGFGASKRVVVWDTTVDKVPTNEILFIFGHEAGHYALRHIRTGLLLSGLGTLPFLLLIHGLMRWLLRRRGGAWRVSGQDWGEDWGAAAVLLFAFFAVGFFADPVSCAISRRMEHQADIFGQEAIHGLVAEPQRTAADSFQRLGELSLDEPDPNRFIVFWAYTHPPIADRLAFAAGYDPWKPDGKPRYFKRN